MHVVSFTLPCTTTLVCVYTCSFPNTHSHTHAHTRTHAHTHAHTRARAHTHTHTPHTHTHTHTHTRMQHKRERDAHRRTHEVLKSIEDEHKKLKESKRISRFDEKVSVLVERGWDGYVHLLWCVLCEMKSLCKIRQVWTAVFVATDMCLF